MERSEIDTKVRRVFASVLGIDGAGLSDSDTPETIPGWDSVTHIQLVMALEGEFDLEFEPDEIGELVRIATIRERIEARYARS